MSAPRRLAVVLAAAALAGGLASPALAADTVTVEAHVSVVGPCLTTTTSVIDFGQLTLGSGDFRPISYSNCSAARTHVFARGTNATGDGGGPAWSLDDSGAPCPDLGLNRFGLRTDTGFLLGTIDREIDEVDAGTDGNIGALGLFMPCAGSDGLGSTMSFLITLTATF